MANRQGYFPNTQPEQADWYTNMAANFPGVATTLGFVPADATAWVNDCLYAAFALTNFTAPVAAFSKAVTGYVATMLAGPDPGANLPIPTAPYWPPTGPNEVHPGIDGRRQRAVDRIKASAHYTPLVIGALLRTENTGGPFDPATCQGLIRSAQANAQGQVVVSFAKLGGNIDGVNLYLARAGHAEVMVGFFMNTPAIDPTPLLVPGTPEQRAYTVQPVLKDAEVGLRSAAVSLLVG